MLIADLSPEDADLYIADRKARGFNTILVSLIEHEFSRNAPNNVAGIAPFLSPGDFARPNERYFSDAEHVLDAALKAGMLVLLAPAYVGANGGGQGWYAEMAAAGPEALRAYGRYVGKRDTTTGAYWTQAGWLALDTVYTYDDVAAATLARYHAGPRRPFFLIEARYEGEHGVGVSEVHRIAYGALLSGASGAGLWQQSRLAF